MDLVIDKEFVPEEFFDISNVINEKLISVKRLVSLYNSSTYMSKDSLNLLKRLFKDFGEQSSIVQPFYCDYGDRISIGNNVFINYNSTLLDGGTITIQDNVIIGPNVSIYSVNHPLDAIERRTTKTKKLPVIIEKDVWIGGNVVICPGVKIKEGCIIAAGSVVTKNTEPYGLYCGNPAKRKKELKK